jgi:hypothetical protein
MRRFGMFVSIAVAVSCVLVSSAGAQDPEVSVLGEGLLAVKAKEGEDEAIAYLSLLNTGRQAVDATISFQAASSTKVSVEAMPTSIPPGEAKRVEVRFVGLSDLDESAQGELVVQGGAQPAARSVAITPAPQPSAPWPELFVLGAFAATALLTAGVSLRARAKKQAHLLLKKAPGPKWGFDSWATTATAVGAILGTVLGGATLPETPHEIDKQTLVALNLLFGGLVVLSPFVFQAVRKPSASAADPDAGLWGYKPRASLRMLADLRCRARRGRHAGAPGLGTDGRRGLGTGCHRGACWRRAPGRVLLRGHLVVPGDDRLGGACREEEGRSPAGATRVARRGCARGPRGGRRSGRGLSASRCSASALEPSVTAEATF